MFHAPRPLRTLASALSLALLLLFARPAAADCGAGDDECAGGCIPSGDTCCGSDGTYVHYCPPAFACGDEGCLGTSGPSQDESIVAADGAPYGPSVARACAVVAGDAGSGGAAVALVLGALALARRARRARRRRGERASAG